MGCGGSSPAARGAAGSADAGAGRGGGEGPAKGAGLGCAADRRRVRLQPHDGAPLPRGRWLDRLSPAAASDEAGGAGRALPPASRQRRCGPAGARAWAWDRRLPAHGRAGRAGAAPRAGGRGQGHGALRDATRAAAADRLRLDHGRHRRRARACLPVRGDARLFAARFRRRLPPRAPECLARRSRGCVPALRRYARGAAARQRQGAGHPSRPAHPRGRLQRPLSRLLPVLERPAAGLCALPRADQRTNATSAM